MIDFRQIEFSGDDFWSDHEAQVVSQQIARFTVSEWRTLGYELTSQASLVQERVSQLLGEFNVESAARILLLLAASEDREVALTAREALRGMSPPVVITSAKRLVFDGQLVAERLIEYKSINQILDEIEVKPFRQGAA